MRPLRKQVLGVWHGASENSTVVTALLEDLVERGLNPKRSLLVVLDGAKALRKAVRDLFGARAVVQRCRIHKRRNVLEHLSKEKQRQASWRLKAAWAETDPKKAEAELRKIVKWLEPLSPGAARSFGGGFGRNVDRDSLGVARRFNQNLCLDQPDRELLFAHRRNDSSCQTLAQWRNVPALERGRAPLRRETPGAKNERLCMMTADATT
jgi:hypothetical protein